jgi:hypothetical protein
MCQLAQEPTSCTLHLIIATLTSESFLTSCQEFLSLSSLLGQEIISHWLHFLRTLLKIGSDLQELSKVTWICVRMDLPELHNTHYSSRIISLHIWKDLLSFFDQIFNFESSHRLDVSLPLLDSEVARNTITGIIRECCLLENPRFLLMKYCRVSYEDSEDLVLWGDEEEEDFNQFRKTSRDFLRNFCFHSNPKWIHLSVVEWVFDQTISAINLVCDSKETDSSGASASEDFYHAALTESLLHSLSSLTTGDTLQQDWIEEDAQRSLQIRSCDLLTALFHHYQAFAPHTTPPSHLHSIMRMGVLLAIDLLPIVMKPFGSVPTQLESSMNIFQYLLESLNIREALSLPHLGHADLCSISTVLPFRIKQDHIGIVSLLKFVQYLKRVGVVSSKGSGEGIGELIRLVEIPPNALVELQDSSLPRSSPTPATVLLRNYLDIFSSFSVNQPSARFAFPPFLSCLASLFAAAVVGSLGRVS